ncbi:MAG: S1C family serine protease [Tepidisphaerales bacterium]
MAGRGRRERRPNGLARRWWSSWALIAGLTLGVGTSGGVALGSFAWGGVLCVWPHGVVHVRAVATVSPDTPPPAEPPAAPPAEQPAPVPQPPEASPETNPPAPPRPPRVLGAWRPPPLESLTPLPPPVVHRVDDVESPVPLPGAVDSLESLRALERVVENVSQRVIPATVALQINASSGSGVIVSPDGWVLTAGHVSDRAGLPVTVILHDGRRVRGVTLGANKGVDSGLIRILDEGPWPYAPMGTSAELQRGQWLLAVGHPGGYRVGRSPVVRLGRLVSVARDQNTLVTDNTLVGGDSGGPLFDLYGRVVGIHSRIGQQVTTNMHVPVDAYVRDWERIAQGDVWGSLGPRMPQARLPFLGIQYEAEEQGLRLQAVTPGGPSERAGLRAGDVILRIDNEEMKSQQDVIRLLSRRAPGQVVQVEVRREGAENQVIRVRLGPPPTPAP